MNVFVKNVRCFSKDHTVPLRPLTLLLGENSTGKSTFLAVLATLSRLYNDPMHPSFNESPYELGSFDTIASYDEKNNSRPSVFKIGVSDDVELPQRQKQHVDVVATYGSDYGNVILKELSIEATNAALKLKFKKDKLSGNIKYKSNDDGKWSNTSFSGDIQKEINLLPFMVADVCITSLQTSKITRKLAMRINRAIAAIFESVTLMDEIVPNISSSAPIRTKPKRTYDQFDDQFKPEGEHAPAKLRHLHVSNESRNLQTRVISALRDFGESSGLFTDVTIVPLARRKTSPYQVLVKLGKQNFNLVDVGYGVSQSLPILVQSALEESGDMLLLQQPEVHLHPRAQAAMGTFFAKMVSMSNSYFVVETHSDFLVDRVRQEVAKQTIASENVAIFFFENVEGKVSIHQLKLDQVGNIVDAPPGYRAFFLDEEIALLSRGT